MNTTHTILPTIYLGAPLNVSGERAFLERIRSDLSGPALVIANFFPSQAKQDRQIDFLIWTPCRTVLVELKSLNPRWAVSGQLNGRWKQQGPGGERELDVNPVRQALEASHAVADSMRAFHRQSPSAPAANYKHFDTVVCVDPSVPAGSNIDEHTFVRVLGYRELLDMLTTPAPSAMPWTPEEWSSYLRFLAVYLEDDDAIDSVAARKAAADLAEYRARFRSHHGDDLHELVPITIRSESAQNLTAMDALRSAASGKTICIVGAAGSGKTHHARHAAVDLTGRDVNVIWARVGEYDEGHLSALLARAAAPYTASSHRHLLSVTAEGGQTVIVIDGFRGASSEMRLLEQVAALQTRHPVGVIVTSTYRVAIPGQATDVITLETPNHDERRRLLASYRIGNIDRVPGAIESPFDIATLAAVTADLPADATGVEIHDAFITQQSVTGSIRSGLRVLAAQMTDEIRTSIRRSDVRPILERRTDLGSHDMDAVMDSPLLIKSQGFVRFTHDLHREFLAADHLTATARTAEGFADALADARHVQLRRVALTREPDPTWISEGLGRLADSDLYVLAAGGGLGPGARTQVRAEIASTLAEAAIATDPALAHFDSSTLNESAFGGVWQHDRVWTDRERALMVAAGTLLLQGEFVNEVLAVVDRTDELVDRTVNDLRTAGSRDALTAVFAATYGLISARSGLAVASLLAPLTLQRTDPVPGLAGRIAAEASTMSWGRLYIALHVIDPDHEPALISSLVERAWRAGGYHLQLAALERARRALFAHDELTNRIADLVESFDVTHWALSSYVVEILHAAGRIDALKTVDEILAEIVDIVGWPEDHEHQQRAASVFSAQFEDDVLGPYSEAISQLDADTHRVLLVMAGHAADTFGLPIILDELVDALPSPLVAAVFARHATRFPSDRTFTTGAVHTYIAAVRGWARVADRLPNDPDATHMTADEAAWQLVGQLIVHHERNEQHSEIVDDTWRLLSERTAALPDIFKHLAHEGAVFKPFLDRYPQHLTRVALWGLAHNNEFSSVFGHVFPDTQPFLFDLLATCGSPDTIDDLQPYVDDPTLGGMAVDAIRRLRDR